MGLLVKMIEYNLKRGLSYFAVGPCQLCRFQYSRSQFYPFLHLIPWFLEDFVLFSHFQKRYIILFGSTNLRFCLFTFE